MPTQYDLLSQKLDGIKTSTDALHLKLDAALEQQARHDERIKTLERGGGATLALAATLAGAWLKTKFHL